MKGLVGDRALDVVSVAWLIAWIGDLLRDVPWVNMTAAIVFFWTLARALWWLRRTVHLWRMGRGFTVSKDGE